MIVTMGSQMRGDTRKSTGKVKGTLNKSARSDKRCSVHFNNRWMMYINRVGKLYNSAVLIRQSSYRLSFGVQCLEVCNTSIQRLTFSVWYFTLSVQR